MKKFNSVVSVCISALLATFGLLISVPGWAATAGATSIEGQISKLSDGDTVHFVSDNVGNNGTRETLTIRMIGMDTPELHLLLDNGQWVSQGKWGKEAADVLAKLIPLGTHVTLKNYGKDKYGRTLGQIFKGSLDVNLEMVRNGMAIPYLICSGATCTRDWVTSSDVSDYVKACESARNAGVGIHSKTDPLKEMPFEFRLRMQKRTPDKPVADYRTNVLYPADQYAKIDLCSRIFFMNEKDALKLGFKPAIR